MDWHEGAINSAKIIASAADWPVPIPQVAVFSNVRTTLGAEKPGFADAFNVAFRAGQELNGCHDETVGDKVPAAQEFLAAPVRKGWEF